MNTNVAPKSARTFEFFGFFEFETCECLEEFDMCWACVACVMKKKKSKHMQYVEDYKYASQIVQNALVHLWSQSVCFEKFCICFLFFDKNRTGSNMRNKQMTKVHWLYVPWKKKQTLLLKHKISNAVRALIIT